jgi:acetyl esterase
MAQSEIGLPRGVATEEIVVPGAAGLLHARVHRPSDAPAVGTVVWIRCGGFVLGSLEVIRSPRRSRSRLGARWSRSSIAWRLAPQHPFPAAIDDCDAVVRWVAEHASGPALSGSAGSA